MDFFPEIEISALEAEAIARGLYAVALVDGVHERELALIEDFYAGLASDDWGGGGGATLTSASLVRVGPLAGKDLADALPGAAHRELFVKSAFLCAWADGKISDGERGKITELATALGVGNESQARLEAQVKDFLLRPLANLKNVEGVTAVAKKLGV
jgi:hypothetical protein